MAAPQSIETRLFIDGEFVPSKSGNKFEVINPATEEITAEVFEADGTDVDLAVAAAKAAFPQWSSISGFERAKYFYRLADLLEQANGELAVLEAKSMGRPVGQYSELLAKGQMIE